MKKRIIYVGTLVDLAAMFEPDVEAEVTELKALISEQKKVIREQKKVIKELSSELKIEL